MAYENPSMSHMEDSWSPHDTGSDDSCGSNPPAVYETLKKRTSTRIRFKKLKVLAVRQPNPAMESDSLELESMDINRHPEDLKKKEEPGVTFESF